MYRFLIFIIFFIGISHINAQQTESNLLTTDSIDYQNILNKFLKKNPPLDHPDSAFSESFMYLNQLLNSTTTKYNFNEFRGLVSSNKPVIEILKLYEFRHKVDSLNKLRYKVLSDYWELEQLKKVAREIDSLNNVRFKLMEDYWEKEQYDTSSDSSLFIKVDSSFVSTIDTNSISITDSAKIANTNSTNLSSADSVFFKELEKVTYQDTLNLDSILQILNPYDDTLLLAIDKAILGFQNNSMVQWIKEIRNDTINLYLVNIDGDSLLVQLYENSPFLIRFGLTDYWGTKIPAVIRDVEKRSFKILVDDAPEVTYQTEEKAKRAINEINKNISSPDTLSIKTIPFYAIKPIWIFGGDVRLDMSQVGTHQWAQGGDPFVSFAGGIELFANYKKGRIGWDNRTLVRYGVIRQGRLKYDPHAQIRPNEDRLELSSKYGYNIVDHYFITFDADSKTQVGPAYNWDGDTKGNLKIDFMSPAFISLSLGIDYKPDKKTTLLLAPITLKSTIVLDPSAEIKTRYNIDTTKNSREEFGARFKGIYTIKFWGDIEIKNSLELFSNYKVKPQNIDVNWDFTFVFPVNDFIKATLGVNVIYDDDTEVPKYRIDETGESVEYNGKGIQLKEMLTLGFFMQF